MLEELRDVGRIVLQVAVHRDEHLAARVLDAGGHRRRLPVVAPELHDAHARIAARDARWRSRRCRPCCRRRRTPSRTCSPSCAERLHDRGVQRPNAFLLVVERHDHRQPRTRAAALAVRCAAFYVVIGGCNFLHRSSWISRRSYNCIRADRGECSETADRRCCCSNTTNTPCVRAAVPAHPTTAAVRWHMTCKGQANVTTRAVQPTESRLREEMFGCREC